MRTESAAGSGSFSPGTGKVNGCPSALMQTEQISASPASSKKGFFSKEILTLWISGSAIVFFFKHLYYHFLPFSWPDEALFSSPAASFADRGIFATDVLRGLIPGMETATLWNSPLYMLIVSGIYSFTGESQYAARAVSFTAASASYLIYLIIIFILTGGSSADRSKRFFRRTAAFIPAFDLTFIRAANTVRMDILTLFFFLSALYFLFRRIYPPCCVKTSSSKMMIWSGLAGITTGAGGISHPFSVILVPVSLIFLFYAALFRPEEEKSSFSFSISIFTFLKESALFAAGVLIPFSGWLLYILKYPEIFSVQFLSQLARKSSMATVFGGETGGVFVVFSSQYGGGKLLMLGALAVFFAVGIKILYYSASAGVSFFKGRSGNPGFTVFPVFAGAAWLVFFSFLLYSSEGWYALYAAPFTVIMLLSADRHRLPGQPALPAVYALFLLFFIISNTVFGYRNLAENRTAESVRQRMNDIQTAASGCRTVYLRVRPDPYFVLINASPRPQILEFIPGKLGIPLTNSAALTETYSRIDCFLLDENHSWEERLTPYLEENQTDFVKQNLPDRQPLDRAMLLRRTVQ